MARILKKVIAFRICEIRAIGGFNSWSFRIGL